MQSMFLLWIALLWRTNLYMQCDTITFEAKYKVLYYCFEIMQVENAIRRNVTKLLINNWLIETRSIVVLTTARCSLPWLGPPSKP